MKTYRTNTGPFREHPYYSDTEVERMCSDELRACGLYPSSPQAIRIDRFIEKRFGVVPEADDLPANVLGLTTFGPKGVQAIYVSRPLFEDESQPARRRVTTTLAHEGGHGLLHAPLFAFADSFALFKGDPDVTTTKILCRDGDAHPGYDGRWWEVQANLMMAALILPKALVIECVKPQLEAQGLLGALVLADTRRPAVIRLVSETFDVNPRAAELRLAKLFPEGNRHQLTL